MPREFQLAPAQREACNSDIKPDQDSPEISPENDELFSQEIKEKIRICFDNPNYTQKHSLILDLMSENRSFDLVIEKLLALAKAAPLYSSLAFSLIRNTLEYYTTPNEFSVEKIKAIQQETINDIQWQEFEALIKLREGIFDLSQYTSHDARYIISILGKDICFDIEKTRALALDFISQDEDCRYKMLGSVYNDLCKMYSTYEGEIDPPLALEVFEEYEQMSDDELIRAIHPTYAYNLVMQYTSENLFSYGEEAIGAIQTDIHLTQAEIDSKLRQAISNDINAYQYAAGNLEMRAKQHYDTSAYLQSYVFPRLSEEARMRHSVDLDQRHNYLLNCTSVQVKKRLLMFSPEGDVIGITKQLPEADKNIDMVTALKMSTFLLDEKQPRKITSVAVALTFFDDLPEDLKNELWQITNNAHPGLDWQRYFSPDTPYSFETAIWCAEEIARYFPDDLYEEIGVHINSVLATGMNELPWVDFENIDEITDEMEHEFGKETFDAERFREQFFAMSFESVRSLKESVELDLDDVSLREFFTLIHIMQKNSKGESFTMLNNLLGKNKTKQERVHRLRTLLMLEMNGEMDKVVSSIDTMFSKETADLIFSKCYSLISTLDKVEEFILANFSRQDCVHVVGAIRGSILDKVIKILSKSHETALQNSRDNVSNISFPDIDLLEEELISEIESINSETILFLTSFKSLHEAGEKISLDNISESSFSNVLAPKVVPEDISSMRSIYSQNQAEVGAHDEILAHFDERVKDPLTKFYIFKWQGKIQSFVAFSDKGENLFEATSFNVDPAARGYKIGEAMLEEAIAKEAKEHVLYGECYANLKISAKYIETGWIAERYFSEPGKNPNTTDQLLNIYRDEQSNQQYWGKRTLSPEAVYARESMPELVRVEEAGSQLGLPLHLLNEGYVLTRMFYYEPMRKFIGVFEPDFRSEQVKDQVERLSQVVAEEPELELEGV